MAESTSNPEEAAVVDRISNLPDSILSHILSFLTTKEAVATSILSSRWKPLWTHVPNLNLDEDEFKRMRISSDEQSRNADIIRYRFTFEHIVPRVWALRNANPLRKFRLRWRLVCDPIHVDTWVRAAIAQGLEELDLDLDLDLPPFQYYNLPHTLFNYGKTLVVLKLSGEKIVLNSPSPSSSLGFPSLKILHLHFVTYSNHDSFSRLLSCCPVLQDLSIEIEYEPKSDFEIIVPTLKKLHLNMDSLIYKLVINTPALEYLYFGGFLYEELLLENLSNLVKAVLDVDHDYESNETDEEYGKLEWNLISPLNGVKSLYLYSHTTQCLCRYSEFDLPMFHNLTFLNFCVHSCMRHVLPLFLERVPNLEVLILDKEMTTNCPYYHEECSITLEWIYYEDVPKCVSSHLTAFHFKGFKGFIDELKVVEQVLKWARVLKKMTISSYPLDSEKKVCVLKELLMFPRQSVTCKIEFI
ncbi:FBD-associated F-box protein At3g52670-like isoform X1 [Fagus crenata]